MARIQGEDIETVFLPGGANGAVFLLVNSQYIRIINNDGKNEQYYKSSLEEIELSKLHFKDSWWDAETGMWKKYGPENKGFLYYSQNSKDKKWAKLEDIRI